MNQEVWEYISIIKDYLIVSEKKNFNILDIGCYRGNAFFFLYHELYNINYIGIEKRKRKDIVDEIKGKLEKSGLYDYYKSRVKGKIKQEKILNATQFKNKFIDNVKWGKKIEDYFKDKCLQNKFDIIILSKFIHYYMDEDRKKLDELIDNCWNSLENNGLIFIKNPINSGRKDYSSNDIRNITHKFNELILLEDEKIIIYIGCKSDQQEC